MSKIKLAVVSLLFCLCQSAFALTDQQLVWAFYEAAINKKDYEAAEQYLGATYKQHNPNAEDGKEGLKKYIEYLRANYPDSHSEIKRTIAQDNYVVIHVHSIKVPGTKGQAIMDIFRLDNGKIVEHWDVVQTIPETSANENGMF